MAPIVLEVVTWFFFLQITLFRVTLVQLLPLWVCVDVLDLNRGLGWLDSREDQEEDGENCLSWGSQFFYQQCIDSFSVKDRLVKVFLRLQGFETNLDRFNHLDIFHFAVVLPYILPLPLSFHHHHWHFVWLTIISMQLSWIQGETNSQ